MGPAGGIALGLVGGVALGPAGGVTLGSGADKVSSYRCAGQAYL